MKEPSSTLYQRSPFTKVNAGDAGANDVTNTPANVDHPNPDCVVESGFKKYLSFAPTGTLVSVLPVDAPAKRSPST